jgi:hypothetical protein
MHPLDLTGRENAVGGIWQACTTQGDKGDRPEVRRQRRAGGAESIASRVANSAREAQSTGLGDGSAC